MDFWSGFMQEIKTHKNDKRELWQVERLEKYEKSY